MKKQNRFGTIVICLLLLSAFVLGLIGCVAVPQENGEQESLVKDGSESESVNDKEDTSKQEDTSELEDTSEPEESSDTEEPVEPIVLELLSAVDLMENVTSDQIVVSEDIKDGNVAMTDFAIRLFKAANEEGKSTLISPLSIVYALAMTANGAKGETRTQIEEVIGMTVEELNLYLFSYMNSLSQGKKHKLDLANSIWFTNDGRFTVDQSFLQKNADYYGADIYKAPFDDSTLQDINNWVKYNTDGLIPKALDNIPDNAIMYLINTLLFDAEWAYVYSEGRVYDGKFTTEDGRELDVKMMASEEYQYLEDENSTGFIKLYDGGKYAFAALLPNEGTSVSDYIATLNGEKVSELLTEVRNVDVNAVMPKFETEYDAQMSQILENMGMIDAFYGSKADFSGLGTSDEGNIYISRVIHKTFIEVGEMGTKAGAVTIIETADECEPMEPPKRVVLDRPFVYMIIDCENNIPIFVGTMME